LLAAALAGGCARPAGQQPIDLGGGVEDLSVPLMPHDMAGRDFSSNIPCDLGAGFHACNGMCLQPSQCCTGNDCPSPPTGQALCQQGQCVVSCNPGYKMCGTNCVPNGLCCSPADCASTQNVQTATCASDGTCHVGMCKPGYYDLDGTYQNGCECHDLGQARMCASPTSLGTLPVGGMFSATGNLPQMGAENWFSVTFQGEGDKNYHPQIVLGGTGSEFKMDVLSGCPSQGGAGLACGEGNGAVSTGTLAWEVQYTGGDPPGSTGHADKEGKPNWMPIGAVGNGGTVLIRVFRVGGAVTCDAFTLTISN
jgi:hypothetical protein